MGGWLRQKLKLELSLAIINSKNGNFGNCFMISFIQACYFCFFVSGLRQLDIGKCPIWLTSYIISVGAIFTSSTGYYIKTSLAGSAELGDTSYARLTHELIRCLRIRWGGGHRTFQFGTSGQMFKLGWGP